MRFDDRVTGNLKTYALNAKKIHVESTPPSFNKNVAADAAIPGEVGDVLRVCPASPMSIESKWLQHITELKGDSAVRDIQNLPTTGIFMPLM